MSEAFWKHRPVFVTGATGFMGGWIAKRLVDLGAGTHVLVRDQLPNNLLAREGYWDRLALVRGSIEDPNLLRRAFAEYSIDTVFHLAAQPLVGVAKLDPVGTLETNVRGTWNLLEAARQAKVKRVLVASSDKAYGTSPKLPYREDDALLADQPYDVSKSCTDLISRMYASAFGMQIGIARCANLFGGGDFNLSRFLPGLVRSTYLGEKFVIRSDGQYVRDFLYVEDAVDAYLSFAERLSLDPTLSGLAFNFSLEVQVTVLELTRKILALMNASHLEPVILNQAQGEIREQYLDCSRARRQLGWAPRFNLEQGLQKAIDWYVKLYQDTLPAKAVCA